MLLFEESSKNRYHPHLPRTILLKRGLGDRSGEILDWLFGFIVGVRYNEAKKAFSVTPDREYQRLFELVVISMLKWK